MGKHTVRLHNWANGILETIIREFESLEESLEYVRRSSGQLAKIYDHRGGVVQSGPAGANPVDPDSDHAELIRSSQPETYA